MMNLIENAIEKAGALEPFFSLRRAVFYAQHVFLSYTNNISSSNAAEITTVRDDMLPLRRTKG